MDNFRTEVDVKPCDIKLSYDVNMFFMGSCFATNIGQYFEQTQFNTLVNPFGVLYNPFSIANALNRIMDEDGSYKKSDLSFNNGLWQSFDHHGQFSDVDPQVCLNGINDSLLVGHEFLKRANVLFITFGTAWVYQLAENEKIVSNCHKFPSSHFNRFLTTVEDIDVLYQKLILRLREFNPSIKVILTISPVRHWKDGAHGNQLSKSILHLAVENIINRFDNITYFPAYELLLDDLRDYRFYDDDLLHPSKVAVDYIKNKYIEAWLDENAKQFIKRVTKLKKALDHRPFNKSTEAYSQFREKTTMQLKALQKEYSNISLKEMIDKIVQ